MAEVPKGMCVVLTFERHEDAAPVFAKLASAGIDVRVIDAAPEKVRRFDDYFPVLPVPLGNLHVARVTGSYLVVVPEDRLAEAQELLQA
jgi:hypothetical protein